MDEVRRIVTEDPAPGRRYVLVVAVANPASVEQLMRTATDLAGDRNGQIRVVSVSHRHVTSPFALFTEDRIRQEYADDQRAILEEAVAAAEDSSVPVQRSLLVGTDVAEALRSAVRDVGADALLLGWQEQSRPSDVVLGTTVDPVLRRAPCDIYVERVGTTADGMDAILLPTDGGPHIDAAADLAGAIARANDAVVRVVSYVPPGADANVHGAARDHVRAATERLRAVTVEHDVAEAPDPAAAIVRAAADHDLVALGATRERRIRNRVVGSVARTVARRAAPPIVIAKRRSEESLFDRLLDRWG